MKTRCARFFACAWQPPITVDAFWQFGLSRRGRHAGRGARQWVQGKRPLLSELLLTSGNVHRVMCLKWSVKGE